MVRTQIQLTEQQSEGLKRLAAEQRLSVAQIVRRAVDRVLAEGQVRDPDEIRRRAIVAAGAFRSGRSDVCERHNGYLAEDLGE